MVQKLAYKQASGNSHTVKWNSSDPGPNGSF